MQEHTLGCYSIGLNELSHSKPQLAIDPFRLEIPNTRLPSKAFSNAHYSNTSVNQSSRVGENGDQETIFD